jgi:hypothetical protein
MENIQKYQFAGILNPTRRLITKSATKAGKTLVKGVR